MESAGAEGGAEELSEFNCSLNFGRSFHDLRWVSPTPPLTGTTSYFSIGMATSRSSSNPPLNPGTFH